MQLEPEYDSCRRLSSVSGNIRVQCRQLEVGPVVDESAIFGAKGYVFRHGEVGPAAIDEGTFHLPESPATDWPGLPVGSKTNAPPPAKTYGLTL